jgi:hypothetical protein
MLVVMRTRAARPGSPSPRWQRLSHPGLPHGVTLLSLPWVGATWHGRGAAYWRGRVTAVVVLGGMVAVYVLLYQLILGDAARRSGPHTEFWVTTACMVALTVFGGVANAVPERVTGGPLRALALVSYLLAPGGWLVALVRQLAPTPLNERIAQADLDRQLHGKR